MTKRINKRRRKMLKATAVGVSLMMAPSLAVNVYADDAVTANEQSAINNFVATEPADGATTNLGNSTVSNTTSGYRFPGKDNYTSVFESRARKERLTQDYDLTVDSSDSHSGNTVKVKDWSNLDTYVVHSATEGNPQDPQTYLDTMYFAKEATLIDQSDNTEYTVKNIVIDPGTMYVYYTRVLLDFPIEDADPRFNVRIDDAEAVALFDMSGYWNITAEVKEETPYETIVKIDAALKANQVIVDSVGSNGSKDAKFNIDLNFMNGMNDSNYRDYTSDVIYNDVKALVTDSAQVGSENQFGWGTSTLESITTSNAVNRIIRVGIDFTHYVTEDGTELKPTKFGIYGSENIAGYELASTREEANGDKVYVYKAVTAQTTPSVPATPSTTTPTTPSTPSTTTPAAPSTSATTATQSKQAPAVKAAPARKSTAPKTGDADTILAYAATLFMSVIGLGVALFARKKREQ